MYKRQIVLGAQVTENGPSMMLTGRINSAVRYLQENPDAKAVLTGGQGSNEQMSEAQAMYNCIDEAGISPDRLYIEDKAVKMCIRDRTMSGKSSFTSAAVQWKK